MSNFDVSCLFAFRKHESFSVCQRRKAKVSYKGLFWLLSFLLVMGCSQYADFDKLVGEWGIESADSLARKLKQSSQNDRQEDFDSQPKMRLKFRRNGTFTTTTQLGEITPAPKNGTWKLKESDPLSNNLTIEFKIRDQSTDHEVRFLDDNTIELVPPNMAGTDQKLRFRRL